MKLDLVSVPAPTVTPDGIGGVYYDYSLGVTPVLNTGAGNIASLTVGTTTYTTNASTLWAVSIHTGSSPTVSTTLTMSIQLTGASATQAVGASLTLGTIGTNLLPNGLPDTLPPASSWTVESFAADFGIQQPQIFTITSISNCSAQANLPAIAANGIVSASAFGQFGAIAPGSWIEIYGSNLASGSRGWTGSDFSGVNAPTSLDGTAVLIGGQSAYVDYVSPTQVNVQVPSNVALGEQAVAITTAAGTSRQYNVMVNANEPGLLAPASFIISGKQYVAALFSDGATFDLAPGTIAGLATRRAQPGDTLTLYGIGFGNVTPGIPAGQIVSQTNALASRFRLFFGGTEAVVSYAGLAPNAVGLYQFNVVVPGVPSNDGTQLTFTLGGVAGSQSLYIPVQNGAVAVQLQDVTLQTAQVAGGSSLQGSVVLNAPAPAGGVVVSLVSSSSAAVVPGTVTVAAGATSANFTITTQTVTVNQVVTITGTYSGSSVQGSLGILAAVATAPFSTVSLLLTFQPEGNPSGQFVLSLTPDAGNVTYTADNGNVSFVGGVASNQNQTFTFSAIKAGPVGPYFRYGSSMLALSSGSMSFTFHQTYGGSGVILGTVTGTLTITGTPYPAGGSAMTLTGALTGNYNGLQ